LRRAAADGHVPVGLDLHPVELAVLLGDRPSEARGAPGDRVLVEVAVDRPVSRLDQLGRRREVRHALRQVHAAELVDDAGHLADDRFGEPLDALGNLTHYGTTTSRSIGSTWTPLSLSHFTPRSSAFSSPSSSSAIQP